MKVVSCWMTLLSVLLAQNGCDAFLQSFRRPPHRQHHQDPSAKNPLLVVPPLRRVRKEDETSSSWVETVFKNGTIANELNELLDKIHYYEPRDDDVLALRAANDELQAENAVLKQANEAYKAQIQRLQRESDYSQSVRVTDIPDLSYEGLVEDDPEYKDRAEAAEQTLRQQATTAKASFKAALNRAKEQGRKEQVQSTLDDMASTLQADIQTLRAKQDDLLFGANSGSTITSISLGTEQLERLNSLSQRSDVLVEQYAQEISALKQQQSVSRFLPVGTRTAIPASVALGLAASGLAWSNAELIQNVVTQEDAMALLVAQFREQNADLAAIFHHLIQTLEQLPEWTTATLQLVPSEVEGLREVTFQQMNQIMTAVSPTTVSDPYFVGPLPETTTDSNTFQSGVLWTWSEPLRVELVRQQRDLIAALQCGPDVDITAVKESIRRQYETTEMHWGAVGSEWNRQVLIVVDPVFAFLHQQLDLLQAKVLASNQEFLEKYKVAIQVGREKLEEYQLFASAQILTLDMQARLETMLEEAEQKFPTLQDAETWKEFAFGESKRLMQEFMSAAEALANAWAETARMETDRLQQELVLQLHDAEVYGNGWVESLQLQAETLRLQQQDSAVALIDAIRGNIMDLIPLSQKLISNFKMPEISVEVKSFDVDGMKESVRGQWGKLLQSLSQVELPALPKLHAFGGLEAVKSPEVDTSGLKDVIKVPEMPAKIDFSVTSDAVKWPSFDASAVKETAQSDAPPLSLETTIILPEEFGKQVLKRIPDIVANVPASETIENAESMANTLPSIGSDIPSNAKEQSDLLGMLADYNGKN